MFCFVSFRVTYHRVSLPYYPGCIKRKHAFRKDNYEIRQDKTEELDSACIYIHLNSLGFLFFVLVLFFFPFITFALFSLSILLMFILIVEVRAGVTYCYIDCLPPCRLRFLNSFLSRKNLLLSHFVRRRLASAGIHVCSRVIDVEADRHANHCTTASTTLATTTWRGMFRGDTH